MPRVQLVCQFGLPVRGLSPYGDALLKALSGCEGLQVEPVDYQAAYPAAMHPAAGIASIEHGELHWADPRSWHRVANHDADVMHIQHWIAPLASYLWPLAWMSKRVGKRIVITVHNPSPHESLSVFDAMERKLLCIADVLIVHDSRGEWVLRDRLAGRVCDIRVIPHGIRLRDDAHRQPGDFARLDLDPGRRYVIFFGNLREYKGLDLLLEAWRRIAARLPDVDLIVAGRMWGGKGILAKASAFFMGSGRYAARLAHQFNMSELSGRVILREGFVSDDDIDTLLRISDMAVFPYEEFSSQSGAACRAAGSGCPILVSDVGGLPDLAIDDDWVVKPRDVDDLTRALEDRLSSGRLRETFGAIQLDRIRAYEWGSVALMHASIYGEP